MRPVGGEFWEAVGKSPSAGLKQKKSAAELLTKRSRNGTLARGATFMKGFAITAARTHRHLLGRGHHFLKKI